MSTSYIFCNNVNTTLAAAITSSATSVQLASSANLPTVGADEILVVTLNDSTGQIFEVIYCQGPITGSTLANCLRGQEGTTALNWNVGDRVYCDVTKGILSSFLQNSPFSNSSLSNPGFVEYPNGLIENFGIISSVAGNGGGGSATFALPFATEILTATFGVKNDYSTTPIGYNEVQWQSTLTVLSVWLPGGPSGSSAGVSWRVLGK